LTTANSKNLTKISTNIDSKATNRENNFANECELGKLKPKY